MATRNGLEPSTSSVTGWRANRLHHRAKFGGPGWIITDILDFVKSKFEKNNANSNCRTHYGGAVGEGLDPPLQNCI